MKILGLDWGERKIGLAISEGILATPFGILPHRKNLGEKIKDFCQREGIEKIVVGVSEGKMAQKQKRFGLKIAKVCHLPIEFWDETLTTKEAVRKMIEAGRGRQRRQTEDAVSAALILESYLESQKK